MNDIKGKLVNINFCHCIVTEVFEPKLKSSCFCCTVYNGEEGNLCVIYSRETLVKKGQIYQYKCSNVFSITRKLIHNMNHFYPMPFIYTRCKHELASKLRTQFNVRGRPPKRPIKSGLERLLKHYLNLRFVPNVIY